MKIKLKVKTIIMIIISMIFLFVVAAPFLTFEIAYILHSKGSDKAEVFYDAYLSYPIKFNEDRSLYEMANHLTRGFTKFRLFPNKFMVANNANPDDMVKSKGALEKILKEFDHSKYYSYAYSKIMDLSIANQDINGLLHWIDWGSTQDDQELKYTSDLYKAYYLFVNGNYHDANEILDRYGNDEVDFRYDFLKGNILAFGGDEELAQDHFDEAVENKDYKYTPFGSPLPQRRAEWYSEYISDLKGEYKVKGKVSYNGEPMPFAEIYIQRHASGIHTGYTDLIGITDINGEFETLGLRAGRYEIGVGIDPSILYDKVYLKENTRFLDLNSDMEFDFKFASPMEVLSPEKGTVVEDNKFTVSWEPVDGAEYYRIETINFYDPMNMTGGTFKFGITDSKGNLNIEGTSTQIDIDQLRKFVFVSAYDGDDEDDLKVIPSAILGTFFPGNEYSIMVNAFDSKGNVVGSSNPIIRFYDELTTVRIKGELSIGENYILKGNYEEAIDHYEEILERDPSHQEALIYLSKIYGFGWENRPEYIENAIEYGKRYMDVYDDGSLLLEVIGFINRSSKLEYSDIIHKVFDKIPLDERGSNYYYRLGRFKSLLGEYKIAREAYELDENHLPMDIFYMDLYFEDIDQAMDRLDDPRLSIIRMSNGVIKTNLMEIHEDVLKSDDYGIFKNFLEEIISGSLNREELKELMKKTLQIIDNKNIKAILNEIRLEEYLDKDY